MRIAYYVRITAADTNSIYWVFVATVRDLLEFMIIYYIPYISSLYERGERHTYGSIYLPKNWFTYMARRTHKNELNIV